VDSLLSGGAGEVALPDLSTLRTDISGLFDPSTASADFGALLADITALF